MYKVQELFSTKQLKFMSFIAPKCKQWRDKTRLKVNLAWDRDLTQNSNNYIEIEITDIFQKAHEKLPQTAMNLTLKSLKPCKIENGQWCTRKRARFAINFLLIFSEISPYFQRKSSIFKSFFFYLTMDSAKQ